MQYDVQFFLTTYLQSRSVQLIIAFNSDDLLVRDIFMDVFRVIRDYLKSVF